MEPNTSNMNPGAAKKQRMDFVPTKPVAPSDSGEAGASVSSSAAPADNAQKSAPTPVMSAKAAINAMYAARANQPSVPVAKSAREAVNAAASQAARQTKSAANLHHGSIQKSMESTRTSAASLLRVAKTEQPAPSQLHRISSTDPLNRHEVTANRPAINRSASDGNVRVVRTSLKLGAAARPKKQPVVLPPNSRMVKNARPLMSKGANRPSTQPSKLARLLARQSVDAEVVSASRTNILGGVRPELDRESSSAQHSLGTGAPDNNGALEVQILSSHSGVGRPGAGVRDPQMVSGATGAKAHSGIRDPQMVAGAAKPRSPQTIRDPQMLRTPAGAAGGSAKRRATDMINAEMGQPGRFRAAPRGFATAQPAAISADNVYVMSEPPKILSKKQSAAEPEDLGVVEDYHAPNPPQPLGDKAPIGRITEQRVASGHGNAVATKVAADTADFTAIKSENTSNYSFSKKPAAAPDNNRYTLGGESPFLKSVNVEKRPLSNNAKPRKTTKIESQAKETSTKPSRKNFYPKKAEKTPATPRQDLPQRPTVIIPAGRRSKAPLFFLILLTIILGAAVGAAAYLCFFQ